MLFIILIVLSFILYVNIETFDIKIKGKNFKFILNNKADVKRKIKRQKFLKEIVRCAGQRKFRVFINQGYKNEFLNKFKDVLDQILQRKYKPEFNKILEELKDRKEFQVVGTSGGFFGFFKK